MTPNVRSPWRVVFWAAAISSVASLRADPVIYYATGATAEELQPTIDRFRSDISL